MAQKIEEYEPVPRGRRPTYPWDEWLNGETWELVQGRDFHCTMESMETLIRRTAANSLLTDDKTGAVYMISLHRANDTTFIIKRRK